VKKTLSRRNRTALEMFGIKYVFYLCRYFSYSCSNIMLSAKRPRDALCLSVVSFNSAVFLLLLFRHQIYHCVQLNVKCCSVVFAVMLTGFQRLVLSIYQGQSQLNILHLAVEPFTARDRARY